MINPAVSKALREELKALKDQLVKMTRKLEKMEDFLTSVEELTVEEEQQKPMQKEINSDEDLVKSLRKIVTNDEHMQKLSKWYPGFTGAMLKIFVDRVEKMFVEKGNRERECNNATAFTVTGTMNAIGLPFLVSRQEPLLQGRDVSRLFRRPVISIIVESIRRRPVVCNINITTSENLA
ncbi:hypothetical protein QR680_018818 [Steinernema hermaphroditum]|uniref:Uncharacterized protein n=1 Tax=Steinernema hermaphroditum TaxID=289476 RepID=A0AA39LRB3_9BILA|nr:hypothetical protein QR680_018818 [Steinernema hermaphroditum]